MNQLKGERLRPEPPGRRGGGYRLARSADQLTIGEVMRYIDGPIAPVDCVSETRPKACEFPGCHLLFLLDPGPSGQAMSGVVDQTTFADLVRENHERSRSYIQDWTI